MWIKILIIFFAGILETYLFAGWNLSVNKKQVYISTLLMVSYMIIYLVILDMAFGDKNSLLMIFSYTIACGVGNFFRVKQEKRK